MKRNLAFVVVASLFLALTVSAQEGKDTAPADQAEQKQKEKPTMSMGDMMKRCMEHCQATAKSIEETTKAIEAAKKGDDGERRGLLQDDGAEPSAAGAGGGRLRPLLRDGIAGGHRPRGSGA